MNSSANFVQIIALFTVLLGCITFVNCAEYGDELNCYTKTTEVTPFKLRDDSVKLLINDVEKSYYNQKLYNITCSDDNATCFNGIYSSDHGKAMCVTSYTYVKLNYLDPTTNKSVEQKVKIGVGCSCKILRLKSDDYY